ncbi:MAG: hypothetical protein ABIH03_05925 [Pseudomonadota bacterium]
MTEEKRKPGRPRKVRATYGADEQPRACRCCGSVETTVRNVQEVAPVPGVTDAHYIRRYRVCDDCRAVTMTTEWIVRPPTL